MKKSKKIKNIDEFREKYLNSSTKEKSTQGDSFKVGFNMAVKSFRDKK